MKGFVKDPDATLDYSFDWAPWLGTDTISVSSWVVDSGLTIVPASDSFDADTGITIAFISGGAAGETYTVKNRITTVGGRSDERSVQLRIRQR